MSDRERLALADARLIAADEEIRRLAVEKITAILRGDLSGAPTDDLVEAAVALMRHQGEGE